VGEGVVDKIIEARRLKGDFESFYDFCRKVDYICLNKKTVESLAKAGAFESLGHSRKGMVEMFEAICADIISHRKHEEAGQFSLFGATDGSGESQRHEGPISLEEYSKEVLLAFEKEMLGRYVSDHPLFGVEGLLARMTDGPVSSLGERPQGDVVTIGGMVAGISKRVTRRGDVMLLLALEDLSGTTVEVIVFPTVAEQFAALLRPDAILLIKGRTDRDVRDDSVKLIAIEVHEPKLGDDYPLVINLSVDACTPGVVDQLKDVLANHPGSTQVFLHLAKSQRTTVLRLGSEFWVDTSNGLHAELKALLGPGALASI
jgi:DNA polymerase III subunit alpha